MGVGLEHRKKLHPGRQPRQEPVKGGQGLIGARRGVEARQKIGLEPDEYLLRPG